MTATLASIDKASIEQVRARLDDPNIAAALASILENAELVAVLLEGLNGVVSRSETIGDAVLEGFADLRGVADNASGELDLASIVEDLRTVVGALPNFVPVVAELAESSLVQPAAVARLGLVSDALADGLASEPVEVTGLLSLRRQLKDPDIQRGLGFTLGILKSIGAELGSGAPNQEGATR